MCGCVYSGLLKLIWIHYRNRPKVVFVSRILLCCKPSILYCWNGLYCY